MLALKVLSVALLVLWVAFLIFCRKDGWKSLAYAGVLMISVLMVYASVHFLEPFIASSELQPLLFFLVCLAALLFGRLARWVYSRLWEEDGS